ncbi:MAG: selenium-dependent molybdenum cofactor biosynthesis protein YqeB [Ardenticatenia bacterium]|nr:selenium-dependent molybdenum cofactor biosynthesis protein YqeB [Ardenticatenia bacterium]
MLFLEVLVVMRGGGDLATGVALRLKRAGFPLIVLELSRPLVVRRTVALASAVLLGTVEVEGIHGTLVNSSGEALAMARQEATVPVLVDPEGQSLPALQPKVVVDARMAKRNLDTTPDQAPLVVALGPGFEAGRDCHAVVETNRGHFLGRVYWQGHAEPNTGTPGPVAGYRAERVLRAPVDGIVRAFADIGDAVVADQIVAEVGGVPVRAPFAGVVRGLIADGTPVQAGLKIGDVDPRGRRDHCFTVSDKALAVGGGVLEAVLTWLNRCTPTRRTPCI